MRAAMRDAIQHTEHEEARVGTRAWIGIDAAKRHHWVLALDQDGRVLASRRVANDQAAITQLLGEMAALADELTWAVDLSNSFASLLLALLWTHDQQVLYVPGRAVNRAADGYRGEGKTDAKDALIIADQARLRRDFTPLRPAPQLLAELRLLTSHRQDLAADRVRMLTRLRDHLSAIFPALERALRVTSTGPLVLLARWQTPDGLRQAGLEAVTAYLRAHKVPKAAALARTALAAAEQQTVQLPAERLTAQVIAELAGALLALRGRLKDLDATLTKRLAAHPQAGVLTSLPGIGALLAAEFLVAVGDLATFAGPDQLAAYAGLAPVPRDSGQRTGNWHRPLRYNRTLQRVFYVSAWVSATRPGLSRDYYQRKRREGRRHVQAVLALARRRVNVLWALLRDNRPFTLTPPAIPSTT
jgi:transposase